MKPAPKPTTFRALDDAWDDPQAFARELNCYYEQIRRTSPAGVHQLEGDK